MKKLFSIIVLLSLMSAGTQAEQASNASKSSAEAGKVSKSSWRYSDTNNIRRNVTEIGLGRVTYYLDQPVPRAVNFTTYQKHKDQIEKAIEEDHYKNGEDGVIRYKFEKTQGMLLPIDKFPTANNEPVFISCRDWNRIRGEGSYGGCEARYEYKPNLFVSYWSGVTERNFYITDIDNTDHLINSERRQREKIDQFLEANPDFYAEIIQLDDQ